MPCASWSPWGAALREALAVFPSTFLTLKGEKVLQEAGVRARAVMKPRGIASDCGLALALPEDDLPRARSALADVHRPRWYLREGCSWVEASSGVSTGSPPSGGSAGPSFPAGPGKRGEGKAR